MYPMFRWSRILYPNITKIKLPVYRESARSNYLWQIRKNPCVLQQQLEQFYSTQPPFVVKMTDNRFCIDYAKRQVMSYKKHKTVLSSPIDHNKKINAIIVFKMSGWM